MVDENDEVKPLPVCPFWDKLDIPQSIYLPKVYRTFPQRSLQNGEAFHLGNVPWPSPPCPLEKACYLCHSFQPIQGYRPEDDPKPHPTKMGIHARPIVLEHRGFLSKLSGEYSNRASVWFAEPSAVKGNRFFITDSPIWFPEAFGSGMFHPQRIPPRFDAARARCWLEQCGKYHRCAASWSESRSPPSKLVDCDSRLVVPGGEDKTYVALSYVWGGKSAGPHVQGHPLRVLPRTLEDAIQVTKLLGYRYVWIDQLCINQDDVDKSAEIFHMNEIYQSAEVTLVVAAGTDSDHGIPGVGQTARTRHQVTSGSFGGHEYRPFAPAPWTEVRESRWATRGWTYQEGLLSPRRLVFTPSQAYFECTEDVSMESEGGIELATTRSEMDYHAAATGDDYYRVWGGATHDLMSLSSLRPSRPDPDGRLRLGYDLLAAYSRRKLSFDSDILDAFQAVASTFAKTPQLPIYSLCGIPFVWSSSSSSSRRSRIGVSGDDGDPDDIVNKSLVESLLWHRTRLYHDPDDTGGRRRRADFPSWSWAGWKGGEAIWFKFYPLEGYSNRWPADAVLMRVRGMTTRGGRAFPLAGLGDWWRASRRGPQQQREGQEKGEDSLQPFALRVVAPACRREFWEAARMEESPVGAGTLTWEGRRQRRQQQQGGDPGEEDDEDDEDDDDEEEEEEEEEEEDESLRAFMEDSPEDILMGVLWEELLPKLRSGEWRALVAIDDEFMMVVETADDWATASRVGLLVIKRSPTGERGRERFLSMRTETVEVDLV